MISADLMNALGVYFKNGPFLAYFSLFRLFNTVGSKCSI